MDRRMVIPIYPQRFVCRWYKDIKNYNIKTYKDHGLQESYESFKHYLVYVHSNFFLKLVDLSSKVILKVKSSFFPVKDIFGKSELKHDSKHNLKNIQNTASLISN